MKLKFGDNVNITFLLISTFRPECFASKACLTVIMWKSIDLPLIFILSGESIIQPEPCKRRPGLLRELHA